MQNFFIVVLIISLGAIASSCGKKDAAVPTPPAKSTFFPTVTP